MRHARTRAGALRPQCVAKTARARGKDHFGRRIGSVSWTLEQYAMKQNLVRPEGFEPPTNGFGSHYSIRLSYRRIAFCVYPRGVAPSGPAF